ncbi:hypothetical protein VU01_12112 [Candidatus Electrothrix marina]|uniref:Uncharacterized protein n=1 Tax=Candidatus Electrothrix marina TaxID=1859130 RepID=A0A444JDC7_9BACT|nr:hypothetical protein VU01_12112 [Candidatus Electrothrix marina]
MLGKVFWRLVILLFIGILVIPFILPSYYASQAGAQYDNEQYSENFEGEADGDDGLDIDFKKNRRKTSSTSTFAKSVRSSGGSRSYRSGK